MEKEGQLAFRLIHLSPLNNMIKEIPFLHCKKKKTKLFSIVKVCKACSLLKSENVKD
jgi:hypothetical protein